MITKIKMKSSTHFSHSHQHNRKSLHLEGSKDTYFVRLYENVRHKEYVVKIYNCRGVFKNRRVVQMEKKYNVEKIVIWTVLGLFWFLVVGRIFN
ncbi:hypothetical protein D3C73_278330 [compost metagenome]